MALILRPVNHSDFLKHKLLVLCKIKQMTLVNKAKNTHMKASYGRHITCNLKYYKEDCSSLGLGNNANSACDDNEYDSQKTSDTGRPVLKLQLCNLNFLCCKGPLL